MSGGERQNSDFRGKWRPLTRIGGHLVIMASHTNTDVIFAPLYIHSFSILPLWLFSQLETNEIPDLEPSSMEKVGDRLRSYRIRERLRQVDVAKYAGISRCVYADYEKGVDTYSLKNITKIAELLEAPVDEFIDEYNCFIQKGQGRQIRALRSSLKMSQRDFAEYCGVDRSVVGKWELDKVVILKSTWENIFKNIIGTTGD